MHAEEYDRMRRLEDAYWWFVGRRHLVRELVLRANPDRECSTSFRLAM